MRKQITKSINSPYTPNTFITKIYDDYTFDTIGYEMTIKGNKESVSINDGNYLWVAVDIINTFSKEVLPLYSYKALKNDPRYQETKELIKFLYPKEFNCEYLEGRWYGQYEGSLKRIKLVVEARWPWSIKKIKQGNFQYETKEIIFESAIGSDILRATLESKIKTIDGKIISLSQSPYDWTKDMISNLCVLISASYLHGFNWTETFEGRIFNSGMDIDDFVRKGYIKVNCSSFNIF